MAEKKKILIIDNDPVFVVTAKAALELADYQVLTAINGIEGFEKERNAAGFILKSQSSAIELVNNCELRNSDFPLGSSAS